MNTVEKITIMQAYLDGEKIEWRAGNLWQDFAQGTDEPAWNWAHNEYRIKQIIPVIPWDIINPDYVYAAWDGNGSLYFYSTEPKWDIYLWQGANNISGLLLNLPTTVKPEESLQKRPE